MKNGVLAFALVLSVGACGIAGFAGCSSDPEPAAEVDSGTDAPADTGTAPVDTGTAETVDPLACPTALPGDYACPDKPTKAPAKTCTDVAIQALYDGCFGGDSAKCTKAQSDYKDCAKCVLSDWLVPTFDMSSAYVDIGACMQKIDPASPCGAAYNCWYDCRETACQNCDTSDPATASSVRNKCFANVRKTGSGACYTNSYKAAKECEADAKFAPCLDPIQLFRGACRDNGDWSKAGMELPTDGGTDGATDTGATDSATTDSATTDSATDSGATDSGSATDSASDLGVDVAVDVLPG